MFFVPILATTFLGSLVLSCNSVDFGNGSVGGLSQT